MSDYQRRVKRERWEASDAGRAEKAERAVSGQLTPEEEARAVINAEKLADAYGGCFGCVGGCLMWNLILFVGVPAVILAAVGISNISHPVVGVMLVLVILVVAFAAWLYRKELAMRKAATREEWRERQEKRRNDGRLW